jgi:transposase
MKAYSEDLRKRVVDAVEQGYSRTEIVNLLGVSLAALKRYLKQHRERGHIKAKTIAGRTAKKLAALQAGIVDQLRTYPDVSLERHGEIWEQAHGVRVSRWTMSEAIKRVEWTRKKLDVQKCRVA